MTGDDPRSTGHPADHPAVVLLAYFVAVATPSGEVIDKPVCEAGGAEPVALQRSEFVGPQVGRELTENGLIAVIANRVHSLVAIALQLPPDLPL